MTVREVEWKGEGRELCYNRAEKRLEREERERQAVRVGKASFEKVCMWDPFLKEGLDWIKKETKKSN